MINGMYLRSVIREKCVGMWNECVRGVTDRFLRTLLVYSVRYSRCWDSSAASASVTLCDECACFSYVYRGVCVNYFTGICNKNHEIDSRDQRLCWAVRPRRLLLVHVVPQYSQYELSHCCSFFLNIEGGG